MQGTRFVALAAGTLMGGLMLAVQANAQCAPSPQPGCLRAGPLNSLTRIKLGHLPHHQDIDWKWVKGPQTPLAQLGAPETGADSYAFCIYDTGTLVSQLDIPGGIGWKRKAYPGGQDTLYYKSPNASPYPPHGVHLLKIYNRATGSKIQFGAKRDLVPIPPMPMASPEAVTMQLVNTAGGCWEANYFAGLHSILQSDAAVFKARGD